MASRRRVAQGRIGCSLLGTPGGSGPPRIGHTEGMSPGLHMDSAAHLERLELVALFNEVYSDYEVPMHLDLPSFDFMARLVDIDFERSVVAYEEGRPVAVAMLCLRGDRAWVGGMGVVPGARGRGHGAAVMRAILGHAAAAGASMVDLEVIESNAPAIRIYEALGFRKTRRLLVWKLDPGTSPSPRPAPANPEHQEIELEPVGVARALDLIDPWVPGSPPWQRSRRTIENLPDPPAALAAFREGRVAGAVAFRAVPDRVSVLALGADQQDAGVLSAMVAGLRTRHPAAMVRLLNLPAEDPATEVFERMEAIVEARQLEMRLLLQASVSAG
jgi:GNAT superfamily N-acetyltransferase